MIEIHDVTKRYGSKTAVEGVSFTARPGRVTGFLGPNGAGKSSTLRILLGLDRPTSGHTLIDRELSLPQAWIENRTRCREAHIPNEVAFATSVTPVAGSMPHSAIARSYRCH